MYKISDFCFSILTLHTDTHRISLYKIGQIQNKAISYCITNCLVQPAVKICTSPPQPPPPPQWGICSLSSEFTPQGRRQWFLSSEIESAQWTSARWHRAMLRDIRRPRLAVPSLENSFKQHTVHSLPTYSPLFNNLTNLVFGSSFPLAMLMPNFR